MNDLKFSERYMRGYDALGFLVSLEEEALAGRDSDELQAEVCRLRQAALSRP